jgi:hypothetical protein
MGNRWGEGKGEWGAKGGEVSLQPTRDLSGRESHHDAKEGFQVSKKGIQEQGEGFPSKRGVIKKIVLCTSDIMLILYILCYWCICHANIGLCLGYK